MPDCNQSLWRNQKWWDDTNDIFGFLFLSFFRARNFRIMKVETMWLKSFGIYLWFHMYFRVSGLARSLADNLFFFSPSMGPIVESLYSKLGRNSHVVSRKRALFFQLRNHNWIFFLFFTQRKFYFSPFLMSAHIKLNHLSASVVRMAFIFLFEKKKKKNFLNQEDWIIQK